MKSKILSVKLSRFFALIELVYLSFFAFFQEFLALIANKITIKFLSSTLCKLVLNFSKEFEDQNVFLTIHIKNLTEKTWFWSFKTMAI